ncbi:hypothetical protein ABNF65_23375, partial [Paenibacillus larvae]
NLYIAAKNADDALGCYLEETDGMSDIFLEKWKKEMNMRLRSLSNALKHLLHFERYKLEEVQNG